MTRWLWSALLVAGVIWTWAWLSALRGFAYTEAQVFTYALKAHHTYDFKDIQFFELKSINGSATVAVDGDVDLANALRALDGKKVRVTLEAVALQRIDR